MAGGWSDEDMQGMDLKQALEIHLTSRVFPPRMIMFDTARAAIRHLNRGNYDKLVKLPDGVSYRGSTKAAASTICDHLRLECFITGEED